MPTSNDTRPTDRILIIDDELANVELLKRVLEQGGFPNHLATTDARHALPLFSAFQPDLVLLDLHMPHLDGYAVMKQIAAKVSAEEYLPILVLTADITAQTKQKALTAGARDFLTKPFDIAEVLLRIKNLLETRHLHTQLSDQNRELDHRVRERTRELEEAQYEILERLSLAAEYRDDITGDHVQRVGILSEVLALAVGFSPARASIIKRAAPLHDIGKIGIPDSILLKPGPLTAAEFDVMKTHTTIGGRILSGSRFPILQTAETIALFHHERWDGAGYSTGLSGESIPVEGRIVSVADAFDAMSNDRPYRKALPLERVLDELDRQSGKQFDPGIVSAFLKQNSTDLRNLQRLVEAERQAAPRVRLP